MLFLNSAPKWRLSWQYTRNHNHYRSPAKRKSTYFENTNYRSPWWLNSDWYQADTRAISYLRRIITHISAQPESFSSGPRSEPNPWHVSGGNHFISWLFVYQRYKNFILLHFCRTAAFIEIRTDFTNKCQFTLLCTGGGGGCSLSWIQNI